MDGLLDHARRFVCGGEVERREVGRQARRVDVRVVSVPAYFRVRVHSCRGLDQAWVAPWVRHKGLDHFDKVGSRGVWLAATARQHGSVAESTAAVSAAATREGARNGWVDRVILKESAGDGQVARRRRAASFQPGPSSLLPIGG